MENESLGPVSIFTAEKVRPLQVYSTPLIFSCSIQIFLIVTLVVLVNLFVGVVHLEPHLFLRMMAK
jgi:hypothetical protein